MSVSKAPLLWLVAVAGGAAVLLSGCGIGARPLPQPSEYACTWTSDEGDTFTLSSDGRARLSISADLLLETLGGGGGTPELIPGQTFSTEDATWTIGNGVYYEYDGAPQLQITWFSPGHNSWLVDVSEDRGEVRLLAPRHQLDQTDRFEFRSSDCLSDILDQ